MAALTAYQPTGQEPAVSAVVVDSREATPNSVFVAFAGASHDGHDFVSDAFDRGAIAALVSRDLMGLDASEPWHLVDARDADATLPGTLPVCILVEDTMQALQKVAGYWRSQLDTRVIGITGSVGKTTTKELTYTVLSQSYQTLKSPGNRNNEIGLPLTLLSLRPSDERAVLEMGMYAQGEIARLCELAQPDVGVLTMVGPVHLERLGSMEAITAAKQELVEALPDDGTAILNRDDDRVMSMAPHTAARVFTYGLDERADLWADNIRSMGLDGVHFTLHYGREALNVRIPLLGRHSVHTALRATAVGLVEGMRWEAILAGLGEAPSQLRLVTVSGPNDSLLIDDTYNASPDSVLAALNLLEDLDGRRIAVLGDMLELGDMAEMGHRRMGIRAADVADVLVVIGPLARLIGEEAVAAGLPASSVTAVDSPAQAITVLESLIGEGDVVLIKGSLGMKMDQIVNKLGGER